MTDNNGVLEPNPEEIDALVDSALQRVQSMASQPYYASALYAHMHLPMVYLLPGCCFWTHGHCTCDDTRWHGAAELGESEREGEAPAHKPYERMEDVD